MKSIIEIIFYIEKNIDQKEVLDTKVSAASVGWHMDHILLSCLFLLEDLKTPKHNRFRSKYSFWKCIVMTTKWIPKKIATSPEKSVPKKTSSDEDFIKKINLLKTELRAYDKICIDNFAIHPFFGPMKKKELFHYLTIHAHHHYKIICEILKIKNG